ncbi:MAG: class I SAM-dependent methyltransferase [Nitratireductor sp.]|nr:class I SAM-dependent methyltransferase [Nitratireductor sp.]
MSAERLQSALSILRSKQVPVPRPEEIFVGDGDYLAVSAGFLRDFVTVGGLEPHHHVLDVGCGIGRMAVGLNCYLDPETGSYIGFDPVRAGIDWCRKAYADRPNFRFEWADLYNELYHPGGNILSMDYTFPCDASTIDFAIATSIFTHLYEREIETYFREFARVVKPGGRVFSTAYLFDGDEPVKGQAPHLQFNIAEPGYPYRWHVEGMPPLAAVCYSESYFADLVEWCTGRKPDIRPGRWRGAEGPWFQDLVLL